MGWKRSQPSGKECQYAHDAVQSGGSLLLSEDLNPQIQGIVASMLQLNPSRRMSAGMALEKLSGTKKSGIPDNPHTDVDTGGHFVVPDNLD